MGADEVVYYGREFIAFIFFAVIICFILFFFPATFSGTCWDVNHSVKEKGKYKVTEKMSPMDRFIGILPFGSAVIAHKAFYGEAGWTKVVAVIPPVLFLFRIVVYFTNLWLNPWLLLISALCIPVAVIIMQLLYIIVYIDIANMFTFSLVYKILLFILPQVFVVYMISQLPRQMYQLEEATDDRFSGRNS